jgi:starvation-inducible DNA-binding protein
VAVTEKITKAPAAIKGITRELTKENTPASPIVDALNRSLANGFVLYLNYKHYHWQTYGPLFRDLHLMFDEFAAAVLASLDELAERVRMIGQDPPAHPRELLDTATVAPAQAKATMREHIEAANRNTLIVIKEMRDAARLADDHDDPGTVDTFSKLVQVHEKHEWWLRDILRKRDGLTD